MEEIQGEISFRRAEVPLEFSLVRELIEEDLLIRAKVGAGSTIPNLKSLRATHHKLAQCLAMNFSDAEASISTGYSSSRISILKNDPAFQELMAFYSEKRGEVFVDVQQRMAGFATDTLEVLQERLTDNPSQFSTKDLNNLLKTTADRGGHSPVHKTETKNLSLTGEELLKLKAEVKQQQNGTVRKINQAEESSRVKDRLRSESQDSEELALSSNDNRPASLILEEAKAPGSESKGDDL